ncbi:MAG: DUF4958 family protein [Bacteroidales bacterium]|nr:DUF4958 family protein [Bacteroidales bacterium]
MKKILLTIGLAILAFCGCQDLDSLSGRVDELESRVTYLEELCKDMNGNLTVMQAFVAAHQNNLYIKSVTEVTDGFTITFTDGKTYTLKNGEKGSKGDKGDRGEQGEKGDTGADAVAPVVSITYDETDGGYYWTLNGELILWNGEKISALGVTPELKIEDGDWYISYNGGATWEKVAPAYDYSTQITIAEDADAVYFTLADGTVFTIPKVPGFSFKVDVTDIAVVSGGVMELPYRLTDADGTVRFEVRGEKYSGAVVPSDETSGIIKVTVPDPVEDGYLLVTAVKNSTSEFKAQYITFEQGVLAVATDAYRVSEFGEVISVEISTNIAREDYDIELSDSWIAVVPDTKAIRTDVVRLSVAANADTQRTATVRIFAGELSQDITIVQAGASDEKPYFAVDTEDIRVPYIATEARITVSSNLPWSVEVPEGVTADPSVGSGDAEITLTFVSNEGIYTETEFEVTVSTENADVETGAYTVKVIKEAAPNPNAFTYVCWGNNIGLAPIEKYASQFRMLPGDPAIEIDVQSTDIPAGKPVSYGVTSYTVTNSVRSGVKIDAATGRLTISAEGTRDIQSASVHCVVVTVTVGEGESAVSREIPVFVDQVAGPGMRTYDVRFTPFALRFNPVTGGSVVPSVEVFEPGTDTKVEGFTLDYRRTFHWESLNSPFPSGSFPTVSENPLEGAWRYYFSALGQNYNAAGYAPVSYYNNKATSYAVMPVAVEPGTFRVSVCPGAFQYNGEYGEGMFSGTLVCGRDGESPITANKEHRPFLVWLDPSYEE